MGLKDWILLGAIILALLVWKIRHWRRGRISGKKPVHANAKAVQLLEEAGYEVLKAKPSVTVQMEIDGRPHPFELKNDYLVLRGGRRYIVRIRKDSKQARLHSKLWRGTLLRDVLAYGVNGVLVLHVEKETLQEVRFRM